MGSVLHESLRRQVDELTCCSAVLGCCEGESFELEDPNALAHIEELLAAELSEADLAAAVPPLSARVTLPIEDRGSITLRVALPPR